MRNLLAAATIIGLGSMAPALHAREISQRVTFKPVLVGLIGTKGAGIGMAQQKRAAVKRRNRARHKARAK